MTTINTTISEVENKIPVVSDLVKKTDYDAKILEIEVKHITTSYYNKFTSDILDTKIKQKELIKNSDISNLIKDSPLNTKLETLATKIELKVEQDKILKLQRCYLSYFLGKNLSYFLGSFSKYVCLSGNT